MRAKDDAPRQTPSECMTIYRPQGARLQGYIHARRGRVDATRIHNGNSILRQSYTQKTAYRWWIMAYFSHSVCTAHGTPPFSGAHLRAEVLRNPCVLRVPSKGTRMSEVGPMVNALRGGP